MQTVHRWLLWRVLQILLPFLAPGSNHHEQREIMVALDIRWRNHKADTNPNIQGYSHTQKPECRTKTLCYRSCCIIEVIHPCILIVVMYPAFKVGVLEKDSNRWYVWETAWTTLRIAPNVYGPKAWGVWDSRNDHLQWETNFWFISVPSLFELLVRRSWPFLKFLKNPRWSNLGKIQPLVGLVTWFAVD